MFLYNIFVLPIIFLLEILIHLLYPILNPNPVLATMILSFIVNFITYPVFAKIEFLCQQDSNKYQTLLPRINSIKTNFSGWERRMLLKTYFRQNNYHPLLAHFKQSLIIFLQVPIFVASYIVVSKTFLFQSDLITKINEFGNIGFIPIHTLPILMTIINISSILIYTKDKSRTAKIYSYSLPAIFLILLYFSPASIVLYWIFNNTFALLRNVWFYKKKQFKFYVLFYGLASIVLIFAMPFNPRTQTAILTLVFIALIYKFLKTINKKPFYILLLLFICTIYFTMKIFGLTTPNDFMFIIILSVFLLELSVYIQKYLKDQPFELSVKQFLPCILLMFAIFSVYLPLKLINSDPIEFYRVISLWDLLKAEISIGFGLFFLYPILLFYVQKQYRKLILFLSLNLLIIFTTSMYTFVPPKDVINVYMQFGIPHTFSSFHHTLWDTLLFIITFFFVFLLFKYRYIRHVNLIIIALLITYSVTILSEFKLLKSKMNYIESQTDNHISLTFSTKQKNVFLIFLDRAVSGFFPLIMQERPDLLEEFTGFTYCPYTVSFAAHTLYSVPSLFGGYDYTPLKLQYDTSAKMVDKHNQSITLLPEAFRKSGYHVTLFDMPYINYDDVKKESPFHKDIRLINSNRLKITREEESINTIIKNMMWFILFRISPTMLKDGIYNNSHYLSIIPKQNITELLAIQEYDFFEQLIKNINTSDTAPGEFSVFISTLPHNPTSLTEDYQFIRGSDAPIHLMGPKSRDYVYHYNVNMLSWIETVKLLKRLKELDIYDNTRIIIFSDHGWSINELSFVSSIITHNHPVLMVKDFGATGNLKVNSTFMTTADIPYLATFKTIKDEFNPFNLEKAIAEKQKGVDIIPHHLQIWAPTHYKDPDRTYLYDEDVEYLHINEDNIKKLIRIEIDEELPD